MLRQQVLFTILSSINAVVLISFFNILYYGYRIYFNIKNIRNKNTFLSIQVLKENPTYVDKRNLLKKKTGTYYVSNVVYISIYHNMVFLLYHFTNLYRKTDFEKKNRINTQKYVIFFIYKEKRIWLEFQKTYKYSLI